MGQNTMTYSSGLVVTKEEKVNLISGLLLWTQQPGLMALLVGL